MHILKNHKGKMFQAAQSIPTGRRLGLTGTPMQNRLLEMWAVVDTVIPGAAGDVEDFEKEYEAIERGQLYGRTPMEEANAKMANDNLRRR